MLVIFDLDGTLVDSLGDIAHAANTALDEAGLEPYPVARYRDFVGWGLRRLLELAAPDAGEATWSRLEATFRAHYGVSRSRAYDGIPELLADLAGRGDRCAVLSNKPEPFTVAVVDALLGDHPWVAVRGQRDGVPRKPDPAALLEICRDAAVDPGDALMVGDSAVDRETARAAGVRWVGVRWGFGELAGGLDTVEQLRAALSL